MVQFLAVLGLLLVLYALWSDKNNQEKQKAELLEFKKVHEDLVKAGSDVKTLLEHMEQTSESIVEDIALRLEEIKAMEGILQEKNVQVKNVQEIPSQEMPSKEIPDYESRRPEMDIYIAEKSDESIVEPQNAKTIEFPVLKQTDFNNTLKGNKSSTKPRKQIAKEPTIVNEATPKQQMVYAMSNLGYSEEEIARNMNIGKGEVRLILELKRKGEKHNA